MTKHKLTMNLCTLLRGIGKSNLIYKFSRGGGYKDAKIIGDFKVETVDDDDRLIVYIWNPDRPCMVMFLDRETGDVALNDVDYNPKCTVKGNMSRGEGTRGMMTFAMTLMKENGAKTMTLSDNSYIPCEDGTKTPLGPMYFLKNGVTWYEKYFGFKPDERYAADYDTVKKRRLELLDIKFLSSQKCEYFTPKVIKDLFTRIGFTFFYAMSWVKQL